MPPPHIDPKVEAEIREAIPATDWIMLDDVDEMTITLKRPSWYGGEQSILTFEHLAWLSQRFATRNINVVWCSGFPGSEVTGAEPDSCSVIVKGPR